MKIVRFNLTGRRAGYAVLEGSQLKELKGNPFGKVVFSGRVFDLSAVKLLPPSAPSKIVAIGLNYKAHAGEMAENLPRTPLIFFKNAGGIIGTEDNIIKPSQSGQVDYEGELAVIIKKKARNISPEAAFDYILGYSCFNDVTARDLQKADGQWSRAKGFDTFAVCGPWIETELDPQGQLLETYLNGKLKQRAFTADMIFDIPRIVSFVSEVITLMPGDIIATGTPSGIGPMKPGDRVEVRISGIGSLINHLALK
ncbi:MAG: fumarylacetoacetate hydrolase family protein [Dehalococcoides mccartyi]|uniref:fumarylacetoacetate hydrolase family protein n=1 Tax=Dehalococcoides mccartyi TaxID=61435 RepID=UPI0030FB0A61